ncbi:hypothetical protein [Congzhengia minquanensis]|uniref:Uncharacterized protein n=1 Tax=Congzhengia minquanensis TaxID=2763657 RepID=A0A926DP66_9FIRM|nr:hypothetical protein [Congzhengia minquanensis]MBC8540794.1 hypothetical protein [Congzhengia minquanensis]
MSVSYSKTNQCVSCGCYISEDRQVCSICEKEEFKPYNSKRLHKDKASLWEANKKEFDKIISREYIRNKKSMDFLHIDKEEFNEISNVIIVENLNKFDELKGTLNAFVSSVLKNKIISFINSQNTNKRKANYFTKGLKEKISSNADMTIEETLTVDIDAEVNEDFGYIPAANYISMLSEKQKTILIFKLCGYSHDAIMKTLHLSYRQFNNLLLSMKMIEKTQLIRRMDP